MEAWLSRLGAVQDRARERRHRQVETIPTPRMSVTKLDGSGTADAVVTVAAARNGCPSGKLPVPFKMISVKTAVLKLAGRTNCCSSRRSGPLGSRLPFVNANV